MTSRETADARLTLAKLSEIKSELRGEGMDACVYYIELARMVLSDQIAGAGAYGEEQRLVPQAIRA